MLDCSLSDLCDFLFPRSLFRGTFHGASPKTCPGCRVNPLVTHGLAIFRGMNLNKEMPTVVEMMRESVQRADFHGADRRS